LYLPLLQPSILAMHMSVSTLVQGLHEEERRKGGRGGRKKGREGGNEYWRRRLEGLKGKKRGREEGDLHLLAHDNNGFVSGAHLHLLHQVSHLQYPSG
jgi:hypothetical protein